MSVNGDTAQRIYNELMRGITQSSQDTAEEGKHQEEVARPGVAAIGEAGDALEPWKEIP
jgi:hypothetical protein